MAQARPARASHPRAHPRDHAIDLIKGIACLLMVVAHVNFVHAPWLRQVTMASVLFFASTGMNLTGLLERRGEDLRLGANALFLIFAGFADNYVQGTLWKADVFQSAGLAMLAMIGLRRLLPRAWTWLWPLPFVLHVANQHLHWKTIEGGVSSFLLTPGVFPMLPWLAFYLLGAHIKKYRESKVGVLVALLANARVIAVIAAVILAARSLWMPFHFDKFWMTPEYFLIGCITVCLGFDIARTWCARERRIGLAEVRKWGSNSLVFYILHTFVIRALEMFIPHGLGLFALAVVITAMLLRPALSLQEWTKNQPARQVLIAGVCVTVAVLAAEHYIGNYYAGTLLKFGLTLSFIGCYPAWKNLSARLRSTQVKMPPTSVEPALTVS